MKEFFQFFVKRHTLALLFTIMMVVLGVGALFTIKRDIFPDVDFGTVMVTTIYPGASPEDVELNVTNELEKAIEGVAGIDNYVSYSMENMSILDIDVDMSADDKDAIRDDIREAIGRVTDLPPEVTEAPRIVEVSSREVPIIEVGVTGDVDYPLLRDAARRFERKLENAPGVSRVDSMWNLDREVRVEVLPSAMERHFMTLDQVAAAIRLRNVRATGGSFESYVGKKGLVTLAQFSDVGDVEDVIVSAPADGTTVKVRDVARVVDGFERERMLTRMNGQPAITFRILKEADADIIRTARSVKELADQERPLLPDGVSILFSNDLSYYVNNRFNVVLGNGAIGLVMVVLILALFLNVRAAFWVALSIPVILLGVVFFLPVAGAHMDVIGLAAMILVLGIIVDDGIIVSENIVRRRELGASPIEAATQGIREVSKPVLATLATTFLAFAPMFYMSGVFGEFVVSIPLVITLAVLISVAEVIVALPAHLVSSLKHMDPSRGPRRRWFSRIRDGFQRIMEVVLKLRYAFLALSVLLFTGAIAFAVFVMDFVLFPSTASNAFRIHAEMPLGSSLENTRDRMRDLERLVEQIPDDQVASYTTYVGSHGERTPGEFEHLAYLRVDLTPYSQRGVTADEIVEGLRPRTDGLGGFEKIFYVVEAGGPPVGPPVSIRVVGADDEMRKRLADAVQRELSVIDGVKDIDRNDRKGKPEVRLDLQYDKLPFLGLSVADVARTIRLAFDGEVATSVRYGDEDVDFRVIMDESARADTDVVNRLLVRSGDGRLIPLGNISSLSSGPGPSSIYHHDGLRATTITADLDKETVSPIEVSRTIQSKFDLARDWPGMRFVMGGESEETAESFKSLGIAFLIAIIAIYFILVLLFDSFTQPVMVMIAIPFGVIAVIIAFAIHGQTPGFLAALGLVGLTGVVVNDSLVMVSHINDLRTRRPDATIVEIVAEGAANRLRAITMTTITTVVGLIPLAYGIGGSDPFIAPMALALGYGLLFATPLTLVMIPSLYVVRKDIAAIPRWILGKLQKRSPGSEDGQ